MYCQAEDPPLDGVLFLCEGCEAPTRMRIFNADGSEAEMCGNGLRCVAHHLYLDDWDGKACLIETGAGLHQVWRDDQGYAVKLPNPTAARWNIHLSKDGRDLSLHFLNTGVPHVVMEVEELGSIPLDSLGRWIRRHSCFQPSGANADFFQVRGPQEIMLRTYERGVEGETLACGTGAVAAALVAARLHHWTGPIRVRVQSGEEIQVSFRRSGDTYRTVHMQGPAVQFGQATPLSRGASKT